MATPPEGLLLHPLVDQVQFGAGQGYDMKRIHHRHGIGNHRRGGGLVPANPSIAMTSTPWAKEAG